MSKQPKKIKKPVKKSQTDVVVILDRSGSMVVAKDDHEGGLKNFVKEQQKVEGDAYLTFVRFDSVEPFDIVYDRQNIKEIEFDTLKLDPRGGTPLLDAVGNTLNHIEKTIPKDSDDVLIMIITDGMENSSREFTNNDIKNLVKSKSKWTFMFLGANIDAFTEASNLGININTSAGFSNNSAGVRNTYANLSGKFASVRAACNVSGSSVPFEQKAATYNFTEEERKSMKTNE